MIARTSFGLLLVTLAASALACSASDADLGGQISAAARPLTGADSDLDPVMDLVGDARFVLIGEASHGTDDFYRTRADITRRLIQERGLDAVVMEADWASVERLDHYVRGEGDDQGADAAFGGFQRFPTWMWGNTAVRDFVVWLRAHNDALPAGSPKVGMYGFDLYGVVDSMDAVVAFLEAMEDPAAADRARARYGCLDPYRSSPDDYGLLVRSTPEASCGDEVKAQREEMESLAAARGTGEQQRAFFHAVQNARAVEGGEAYYRAAYTGSTSSWNVRDTHMAGTLDGLQEYLEGADEEASIAVWAHNSHLGDAQATDMGRAGEINVGQLVRERHGNDAVNIGFTTHTGTVMAASKWGGAAERKAVQPSMEGSYERLFHEVGLTAFFLSLKGDEAPEGLSEPRLERAIGVIYRPATERVSHYFSAVLPEQFDAILHIDVTRAVDPLEGGGAE
ncbi:erythromycin esterase family protein [Polyangium aurulentum]|uniref:erythromycin esterase family protein n=1 Tax=Polyangium aurulentum TaxID=2567896 RepID=UPI0010ADB8BF|nr:erythromycin esterase family protein [Polyangium aurulentum]UQA54717.1 erythromycin esterase family protein [Polyangium aurulentum]